MVGDGRLSTVVGPSCGTVARTQTTAPMPTTAGAVLTSAPNGKTSPRSTETWGRVLGPGIRLIGSTTAEGTRLKIAGGRLARNRRTTGVLHAPPPPTTTPPPAL